MNAPDPSDFVRFGKESGEIEYAALHFTERGVDAGAPPPDAARMIERPTRCFNIAGPCFADEHYMLPAERRAGEAMTLVAQGRWFMLVSGRQTGKTTVAQWMASRLNADGGHLALWIDVEDAREQPDIARAIRVLLDLLDQSVARRAPEVERPPRAEVELWMQVPETALGRYLSALSRAAAKPLVLFFDEADTLVGPAMVSFLTQLRALYLDRRETPAPRCVVLAGVRAARDYPLAVVDHRAVAWLGTASPFNVTVENVGLAPFTEADVSELLAQHTAETGQRFEAPAEAMVYALSAGHPWLVNALADQCTRRDVPDRAVAITATHVESAKETLILERRTHIDSLAARLQEERVRRVIDPMLAGRIWPANSIHDDVAYVAGLGLIRLVEGQYEMANPIYREVVPRMLTMDVQQSLHQRTGWYVGADGLLDVPKLMAAWQVFWREDGHLAAEGFQYKESGPHLMLMAFLQRIVNGGGRVEREYALGKDALDLLLMWKTQRAAIELKLWRRPTTEAKGHRQLSGYLDALGLSEGWLVLLETRPTIDWTARSFTRTETVDGRTIHVVGC